MAVQSRDDRPRPHRRPWGALRLLPLPLLPLLLSGCTKYPLWPIDPVSPTVNRMDQVWTLVSYIGLGILAVVGGLMVYAVLRFGRRDPISDDDEPPQIHGNSRLELTWTLIPILIVTLLLAVAVATLQLNQIPPGLASSGRTMQLNIQGYRWAWAYSFPQLPGLNPGQPGTTEPNHLTDLHLPLGNVEVAVTARDVVHDWWVPALDGHLDAWPGHIVRSYYTLKTPGAYYEECSKFCGLLHWTMHNDVIVESPAAFARWAVANGAKAGDVSRLLGIPASQFTAAVVNPARRHV